MNLSGGPLILRFPSPIHGAQFDGDSLRGGFRENVRGIGDIVEYGVNASSGSSDLAPKALPA